MSRKLPDTTPDDATFERLVAEARLHAPQADAALLARVLKDAEEVQAGFAPARHARRTPAAGWVARVRAVFRPRPGALALASAAASLVLGLSLGLAQPERVASYLPASLGETLVADAGAGLLDEIPLDDDFQAEG